MPYTNTSKKASLTFHSINDLSKFKNGCTCNDFYVDRDALTLVGTFTEEQRREACHTYLAACKIAEL